MDVSLRALSKPGPDHGVVRTDEGFAIVRRRPNARDGFNRLARAVIDRGGIEYVALPRSDGRADYDQVLIIPLD